MRRNTYVILIATALVAAVSLFLPDREPPENAVQPPATSSTTTSADVRDTGASTDEPAEEYSYGRGYVVEDPDPTEIPEEYSEFGAADIARVATDNGLLLHRYEVGFHEQNQAMVRAYPLYETTDYADNSWYTWDSPTTGMTILMNNPHTGDNTACTLAGFARDPETDDTYGITAGHCAEQGHTEVYWRPATSDHLEKLGTVALWQTPGRPTPDSPFPFDTDVALILLNGPVNPLIANVYQATAVFAPEDLVPGQQVCKMGYRTEVTCGSVIAVNNSFVRVHLYTLPGDSGGLLYAPRDDGTAAIIGILSGSPSFTTGETHDFLADFALVHPFLVGLELQYQN
ncbi:S1 family peptidase [uncultured Corynebacterium sp.]|uniref:S1 family peptidase n=1 Tax=uncultured Corynebacterium sp. TaxID=159447 RepID=UPI00260AF2C6|nr:S1 family peptidase [uncultured Corynebacterium sp.]